MRGDPPRVREIGRQGVGLTRVGGIGTQDHDHQRLGGPTEVEGVERGRGEVAVTVMSIRDMETIASRTHKERK
jgi:hypothetical protein